MTNKIPMTNSQNSVKACICYDAGGFGIGHWGFVGHWNLGICRLLVIGIWSFLAGAGCAGATKAGYNSALDSTDLVKMTNDMAGKMLVDPEVQREIVARGTLRVVVQPVENRMTAEVLPRGPAEAFTGRLRVLLSQQASGAFTWVMNRDAFYRLRATETNLDLGPEPGDIDPDFALTARFSSLTTEDAKRRSAYYLCVYELTNLRDRTLLWSESYEVQKVAVKGFLD